MYDQLNKIWAILGTPSETTWPGVSKLPEYKPCKELMMGGGGAGSSLKLSVVTLAVEVVLIRGYPD